MQHKKASELSNRSRGRRSRGEGGRG